MEYTVIEKDSLRALAEAVEYLMKDGWRPQGGVFVALYDRESWYYQAMMRRPEDKKD